jgi:chromosome segregation ATPase
MSDTPRTDAAIAASDGQWSFVLRDLAQELERELAVWKHEAKRMEAELETFDEQAIIWWCEYQDLKVKARQLQETRSDLEFRRGLYKLQAERVERLERQLEQEHQDRKQAELDVCRALGERNEARAELASLKATIADPDEVELAMIRGEIAIPHRVGFDYIIGNP